MKLLYHGLFFPGSTALHRLEGFAAQPGIEVISHEARPTIADRRGLVSRLFWRARWPLDVARENSRLLEAAAKARPDVVFIDNSKVIARSTLRLLRRINVRVLAYYSPDDILAPHNLSWPLRRTFRQWDIVFTTKSFNVAELRARNVRKPYLVGNAFSLRDHHPVSPEQVGAEYERFDLVFIGTYEDNRAQSIMRLAQSGMSIVIYGNNAGTRARWDALKHPNVTLRSAVYAEDYSRCLHHGKIALCFLRKANRDQITTRSVEIAAAARPMLAERTAEHDAHFVDGSEYISFSDDSSLVSGARALLSSSERRSMLGAAGRARCLSSGYDSNCRATEMLLEVRKMLIIGDGINGQDRTAGPND